MSNKNNNRKCTQFYCDTMRERVCCCGCPNRKKCKNPCLNSPDKCGLEDKGQEKV